MKIITEDKLFEVRDFQYSDTDNLAPWMSTSKNDLFTLSSSLHYPLEPQAFLEYSNRVKCDEHKLFSLYLKKEQAHVGHFEIKNINKRHNIGTMPHVVLAPEYRGKGLGFPFVNIISKTGFKVLSLYRIGLSVQVSNKTAIAVYVRAGYVFEGLIRKVLEQDGTRYSLYQMSLLRDEWDSFQDSKN